MSIPLATTTITVWRIPVNSGADLRDPTDAQPAHERIASGVRAQISSPFGRERNQGGVQEVVEFSLSCDPTDMSNLDRIEDDATGEMYEVVWARQRVGLGLDHTRAGLKQVTGFA